MNCKFLESIREFPHVSDETGVLINADCRHILPLIPDNSVKIILTDSPYGIKYDDWDDWEGMPDFGHLSSEWYRLTTEESSVFCFAGWSRVCQVIGKFDSRFTLNDWIIYDRIKGRGAKKRLVSTREDLLWYVKSDKWIFNKEDAYSTIKKKTGGMGLKNGRDVRALFNVWTDISPLVPWSKERTGHSTQKPEMLSDRILKVFSGDGGVLLDSFAGSGTFLASAKKKGIYFIGIEKDTVEYERAQKRLFGDENQR